MMRDGPRGTDRPGSRLRSRQPCGRRRSPSAPARPAGSSCWLPEKQIGPRVARRGDVPPLLRTPVPVVAERDHYGGVPRHRRGEVDVHARGVRQGDAHAPQEPPQPVVDQELLGAVLVIRPVERDGQRAIPVRSVLALVEAVAAPRAYAARSRRRASAGLRPRRSRSDDHPLRYPALRVQPQADKRLPASRQCAPPLFVPSRPVGSGRRFPVAAGAVVSAGHLAGSPDEPGDNCRTSRSDRPRHGSRARWSRRAAQMPDPGRTLTLRHNLRSHREVRGPVRPTGVPDRRLSPAADRSESVRPCPAPGLTSAVESQPVIPQAAREKAPAAATPRNRLRSKPPRATPLPARSRPSTPSSIKSLPRRPPCCQDDPDAAPLTGDRKRANSRVEGTAPGLPRAPGRGGPPRLSLRADARRSGGPIRRPGRRGTPGGQVDAATDGAH